MRHVVLNAKFHEREAEIVAQAGRLGMVTISTNMAGRGTDILLGGNPDFMARQELVKKNKARAISVAEGAINPMAPAGFMRFYYQGQEFEVGDEEWAEVYKGHAEAAQREHDEVIAAGGSVHSGHGAARVAAHRQPASRARGTAGRSGRVEILFVAGRRFDAHLRQAVGVQRCWSGWAWKKACPSSRR